MINVPIDPKERLNYLLDLAWSIFINRLALGRINVNKESSMQLHYASFIHNLGELMCLDKSDVFKIELEHSYENKNVDIVCYYNDFKAAIELKCFRKSSNRATDNDMYDVLKDIEKLMNFNNFAVKRFVCLTDNPYYINVQHSGQAEIVSTSQGTLYYHDVPIVPTWVEKRQEKSRDRTLQFKHDVGFEWLKEKNWYYLNMRLE
ncbi:hypothetical protein [Cohnella abietis]|uniref:Uncharacterized protein n=1 Tax=Cohnella abietis TaxID=2507935 RepID=A0A3T1DA21_9BACL|nr:hypothetical protein [Cohnella abietis]BBI34941.1 hypothetical protein KCTCHS21_43400 [Cohnella abietis]